MTECPICFLDKASWASSVSPECNHSLCLPCFISHSRANTPACPICRKDYLKSVIIFGDDKYAYKIASLSSAFKDAVTIAASLPESDRDATIQSHTDKLVKALDEYNHEWKMIRYSQADFESLIRKKCCEEAVEKISELWDDILEFRTEENKCPIPFNLSMFLERLTNHMDCAREDGDNDLVALCDSIYDAYNDEFRDNKPGRFEFLLEMSDW